jgi:hypothetical protein
MRKFTKRDILRFANHEAGHVVHHVMTFGHEFDFVWVKRTDDEQPPKKANGQLMSSDLGGCVYRSSDAQICCTTFEWVSQYMAGLAGERINRKNVGKVDFYSYLTGCRGDIEGARAAIRESNEKGLSKWIFNDPDKLIDDALASVHRLLTSDQVRRAHVQVAEKLIERGRLSYDEVREIVYRHLKGTASDFPQRRTSRSGTSHTGRKKEQPQGQHDTEEM